MAFEGHKGRKAKKGQEGQKNKYGSKCLELSNSARNAKIAKNFQKVPKAWRSMDIRPNGLWSWNYIYIYVRNIMLIFIHHNLLNTIFRKKLTQASTYIISQLMAMVTWTKKKFKQIYQYRTKGTYCGYMGDHKEIKKQHSF